MVMAMMTTMILLTRIGHKCQDFFLLVLKPCCAEKNFSSHIVHWFLVSIWRSRQRALQRLNCSVVDLNPADSLNPHLPESYSTLVYHTSIQCIILVYYTSILKYRLNPADSLNRHLPRALIPIHTIPNFTVHWWCQDQPNTNDIKMCSVEAANCGVLLDWMML